MPSKNPLEDHELEQFLGAAEDLGGRREMIGYLLPHAGLRASAAAHLTVDWLDFQREEIKVPTHLECSCSECTKRVEKLRDQYRDVDGALEELESKSKDEIRDLDVTYLADLNKRLGRRAVREIVDEGDGGLWTPKSAAGARRVPVRNVKALKRLRDWFGLHDAVGVTRQTIHSDVSAIAEEAALRRKVYPHHLRHTFGTKLASNGANASFIQSVMGHERVTTSEQYIDLSGERLHQQADEVMF